MFPYLGTGFTDFRKFPSFQSCSLQELVIDVDQGGVISITGFCKRGAVECKDSWPRKQAEAALCAASDKLHQKSPLSGWRFLVQGDAEK